MTNRLRYCEAMLDEPGSGRILLLGEDHETGREVRVRLLGGAIGRTLREITALALSDSNGSEPVHIDRFGLIGWEEARLLLPNLQRAVVEAAADGEKYERTCKRDLDESPDEPMCTGAVWGRRFLSTMTGGLRGATCGAIRRLELQTMKLGNRRRRATSTNSPNGGSVCRWVSYLK